MILTTNSLPVRLTPGPWFFAIQDVGQTFNYDYFFTVTEFTTRPPLALTNCFGYTNTAQPNAVDYYTFIVSNNTVEADFRVRNIVGGNVDMYIIPKGMGLPGPQNYFYARTNVGAAGDRERRLS